MTELIDKKQERLDKILQKIVKDIERFLKKHATKEFYAFAFDCSKDVGEILWAFNTEKALASLIKSYKKDSDDPEEAALYDDKQGEMYLSMRYGIGDWNYTTQSKAYYIFGNGDKCLAMSDKAEELDPENGVEQFEQEVMNFFEELLLLFCQTDTFKAIPKTADFKVLFSEHNDNQIDDTMPRSEAFMQRLNALIDEKLDYQFPKIPAEARTVLSEIDEQLFNAIRQGDNKEVQRLLENGANVNAVFKKDIYDNKMPLHTAVECNNLEAARLLIEHGANVNAKERMITGWYPLRKAIYRSVEMARLLLDNGADVDKAKALIAAVDIGEIEIVEMLLSKYKANPNVDYIAGTALSEALGRHPDNHQLIKILLDYGADPNLSVKGQFGISSTPLIKSFYGSMAHDDYIVKNVQLLLDAGADANMPTTVKGIAGMTPLMWLMRRRDGHCDRNTHLEVARMLIKAGADVNAKDKNGKSVLDYLPQSSRLMRQLLEEHGAKS
ncbi:MAG: ankyrin repeat domain-containing protein [Neisseriaceae bacterium]|nr:ankyrin repeat domain-containing protein [Neisseriaceae bacterium]